MSQVSESTLLRRSTRSAGAATIVHYLSLVVAAVLLLRLGRNQSFFFDDWALLVQSASSAVNEPHVGHWTATPALVFLAFRALFGLSNYLPFLALAFAVHLLLAHLLWRVMLRAGVDRWVATALGVFFLLVGAGSENILWAFQFGFVGAIALGVWVVLLLARPVLTRATVVLVVVLATLSLTFSGTALPVLGAAGIVALAMHGWRKTLALFAVPAVVYGVWFLLEGRTFDGSATRATGGPLVTVWETVRYAAHMFVDGLQRTSPVAFTGWILTAVLAAWLVVSAVRFVTNRRPALETVPVYALIAAAIVFALITGYSRSGLGVVYASSGRYAYFVIAMLVPAAGLIATQLVRRRAWLRFVALALIVAFTVYNAVLLRNDAAREAAMEAQSADRLASALEVADETPGADPGLRPESLRAPDVTVRDLLAFQREGWLSTDRASQLGILDVGPYFWLDVSASGGARCDSDIAGPQVIGAGEGLVVTLAEPATVTVALWSGDLAGAPRALALQEGSWLIENTGDYMATADIAGDWSACAE